MPASILYIFIWYEVKPLWGHREPWAIASAYRTPCARFKDRLVLLILTWMVCKCFHSYYITCLVSNNIIKMVYYSHVVVAHKRIFKYLVAVCAKMQFVDDVVVGVRLFFFFDDSDSSLLFFFFYQITRLSCWTPYILYVKMDGGRRSTAMLCVRYCIWSFINIHWKTFDRYFILRNLWLFENYKFSTGTFWLLLLMS